MPGTGTLIPPAANPTTIQQNAFIVMRDWSAGTWQLHKRMHCLEIQRRAGAEPDQALFQHLFWDEDPISLRSDHVAHSVFGLLYAQPAEYFTVEVPKTGAVLHWGRYSATNAVMDQANDGATLTVRDLPDDWGGQVQGMRGIGVKQGAYRDMDIPCVFNPEVAEELIGNMMTVNIDVADPAAVGDDFRGFVDTTDRAAERTEWTLADAVHYLSRVWMVGSSVLMPTLEQMQATFGSAPNPRNVRVEGMHPREAISALIEPSGFRLKLWYGRFAPGGLVVSAVIFPKQGGAIKSLGLQQPGQVIDRTKSNVARLSHLIDRANLANVLQGIGARKRFEATFTLSPDWDAALEGQTQDKYEKDESAAQWQTYQYVHRKFGLREDEGAYTTAFDFSSLFGVDHLRARRRFLPCFSVNADGRTKGIVVDYTVNGTDWKKTKDAAFVFDNECSIYFDGSPMPAWLWDNRDEPNFKIRVTAVVESDDALNVTVGPTGDSWETAVFKRVLDVAERFYYDQRPTFVSTNANMEQSIFIAAGDNADTVDDTTPLTTWLTARLDTVEELAVSSSVIIPGLHLGYDIGDRIAGVAGRNMGFDLDNKSPSASFPQVVAITYSFRTDDTHTELILEDPRAANTQQEIG